MSHAGSYICLSSLLMTVIKDLHKIFNDDIGAIFQQNPFIAMMIYADDQTKTSGLSRLYP